MRQAVAEHGHRPCDWDSVLFTARTVTDFGSIAGHHRPAFKLVCAPLWVT